MVNITIDRTKLLLFKGIENIVKPFLGYQIGKKLPWLPKIYKFIHESTKPRIVKAFGQWLILHPDDKVFSNEIISKGVFEEFEINLFSSLLQEGMTVFDIGANIGYYSLLAAAKVGKYGKVYAFEPDRDNFSLLQRNIALNKHHNVELMKYAVADEDGYLELNLSLENKGDHRTRKAGNLIKNRDYYQVKAVTLDSLFESQNIYPSVIKMDIQGFEYFALQGMKNLIKQTHDMAILTEFWPYGIIESGLDSPDLFYKQLKYLGFEIFKIDENSKTIVKVNDIEAMLKDLPGETFTNLLCLKGKFINFINSNN